METNPLEDAFPPRRVGGGDGPLLFSQICRLLDKLEDLFNRSRDAKSGKADFKSRRIKAIEKWTQEHQLTIIKDEEILAATLSLLFPHLRRERVYTMKEERLAEVIPDAMRFGGSDQTNLSKWRLRYQDFGRAVEQLFNARVDLYDDMANR